MKFKNRTLELNNLITYTAVLNQVDDVFKQVDMISSEFKKTMMNNGFFNSGPIIFTYNPETPDLKLKIMTTVGNRINITGGDTDTFLFEETKKITTKYFYRHFDMSESIPYKEIQSAINKDNKKINTIYHVILEFYGDQMIDLYCEVEEI